jgi:hypothetical protein
MIQFLCVICRTELTILSLFFNITYSCCIMEICSVVATALHPGGTMYRRFQFINTSNSTIYTYSDMIHRNPRLWYCLTSPFKGINNYFITTSVEEKLASASDVQCCLHSSHTMNDKLSGCHFTNANATQGQTPQVTCLTKTWTMKHNTNTQWYTTDVVVITIHIIHSGFCLINYSQHPKNIA